MAAEPHHALELVHREADVPERQHGERNEAAGMLAAPRIEMPVVVGLDGREREFLVLHFLEARARKTGKRAEADGSQHAVGVHILDARVGIEAAFAHLLERNRLETVLFLGPAGHGVEAESGRPLALDLPVMGAVGAALHGRRTILEARRDVLDEHVRGLDEVIIDADENQIGNFHTKLPPELTPRHFIFNALTGPVDSSTFPIATASAALDKKLTDRPLYRQDRGGAG